jgi:hypothetical protein
VSFTLDAWSNKRKYSFLAVTAHYTVWEGGKLIIRSRLVAFRFIKGRHTGSQLAHMLFNIFEELGVCHKVLCSNLMRHSSHTLWQQIGVLTMDNASNNDTLMEALKILMHAHGFKFDVVQNRVRFVFHIAKSCL